ncbi:MAG: type VI secretion system protein ImpK [Gammaproteobacteria bacterium]|jgi:type VI secretion system protein ImpK
MRIVDCFTDVLLFTRKFCRGEIEELTVDQVRTELQNLFQSSEIMAEKSNMHSDFYQAAKFPVVSLVDEMLQTSSWLEKAFWSKNPLQRIYFNTTNAGAEFYNRLNVLNKFGPDRDIREVYALCLGLGFRGKYFRGEDRKQYEEIKAFNLSLLLPEEAQRNIDSATLFPFAYKGHDKDNSSPYKSRFSIYPIIIGVPVTVLLLMIGIYHFEVASILDQIQAMVKY